MKKYVLSLLLLLPVFFITSCRPTSNDLPADYKTFGTWIDGNSLIRDEEDTEYYLCDGGGKAYRLYRGKENEFMYCYDAETKTYIKMFGRDGKLQGMLNGKKTEERVPYISDGNLIIPASANCIFPETFIDYGYGGNCINFSSITVRGGNGTFYVSDEALYNGVKKELVYAFIEDGQKFIIEEGITSIGPGAINICNIFLEKKSSIVMPSSVTHIDINAFNGNGRYCDIYFKEVNPDADFSIFKNMILDKAQKEIIYVDFSGSTIGFNNLTVFPETLERIPSDIFHNIQRNYTIAIPDSVKIIEEGAFDIMDSLFQNHRITIISDLPRELESIGKESFRDVIFTNIDINIPEAVTIIPERAFQEAEGINTLVIPSSVKKIEQSAFYEASIKNIVIEEGCEEIGDFAFGSISGLEKITIPSSLKTIGTSFLSSGEDYLIEIKEDCPVYDIIKESYRENISVN